MIQENSSYKINPKWFPLGTVRHLTKHELIIPNHKPYKETNQCEQESEETGQQVAESLYQEFNALQ
jgi:hypothetical protein